MTTATTMIPTRRIRAMWRRARAMRCRARPIPPIARSATAPTIRRAEPISALTACVIPAASKSPKQVYRRAARTGRSFFAACAAATSASSMRGFCCVKSRQENWFRCNHQTCRTLNRIGIQWRRMQMRKALAVLATVAAVAATSVTASAPAQARGFGFGPGLGFGLAAGALAAGAYGAYGYYGPGYGYYGPRYYGYGPAYYGPGPYAYYGGPYYRHRYWRHW